MLPRFDNDFGNADLATFFQGLPKQRISFLAFLLRLEIIRLVIENRIDLIDFDKLDDLNTLCRFHIGAAKILLFQNDEFALLIFVSLDDFLPRHFLAVGFSHSLIINRTQVAFAEQPEFKTLAPGRWIQRNGDDNEAET